MQGVVGMLDVMHATVQEQIEGHSNTPLRRVFQGLKENIETVQDSSKRAVEAADNVVHAYDMNMQLPETPLNENDSPATATTTTGYFDFKPSRLIEGSGHPRQFEQTTAKQSDVVALWQCYQNPTPRPQHPSRCFPQKHDIRFRPSTVFDAADNILG